MAASKPKAVAGPVSVALSEVGTLDAVLLAGITSVGREATFRTFTSGSDGFYGVGKSVNENGHRYQVTVSCIRIGSGPAKDGSGTPRPLDTSK